MALNFINGKAIIRKDRKIIAKVFDRRVFYPLNNIKSEFSKNYPFSLTIGTGTRECSTIEECIYFIEKYTL